MVPMTTRSVASTTMTTIPPPAPPATTITGKLPSEMLITVTVVTMVTKICTVLCSTFTEINAAMQEVVSYSWTNNWYNQRTIMIPSMYDAVILLNAQHECINHNVVNKAIVCQLCEQEK